MGARDVILVFHGRLGYSQVMAFEVPAASDPPRPLVAAPSSPDEVRAASTRDELEAGFEALAGVGRAVSIFGSARARRDDADYTLARAVAERLGGEGYAIVTGGGPGIMEAANRGARDAGANSIGLPIGHPFEETTNAYLDTVVRFRQFYTRKVMFARYSSAFVFFPGGFGTLDELFEIATLIQTRNLRRMPIVLANVGYWAPLRDWLRTTVLAEGKISSADADLLAPAGDAEQICAGVIAATGRI